MALLNKVLNIPIRQEDVDFVMPDVDVDRRLGIDPFLLYRSPRPDFQQAHGLLLKFFRGVLEIVKEGNLERAQHLLICPEPGEIGLGYTRYGTAGSGIGPEIAREIAYTFKNSPALLARGLRHIEELQLICPGVGPDRISDLTANVLKLFLIGYTQEQCKSWSLPLTKDVPISHYFDFDEFVWRDSYFALPVNPSTDGPLLFVPRRILRILPWINYDDYLGEYKRAFLKPVSRSSSLRLKPRSGAKKQEEGEPTPAPKPIVCKVTSQNTATLDAYIDRKEKDAASAEPSELSALQDRAKLKEHAELLKQELAVLRAGNEDAYKYQDLVHRILTFCFHPHLTDGKPQERTHAGTIIRDLVFTNEGTRNFWRYLMQSHGNMFVVFELKNKNEITGSDVDQIATYLGDTMGRFGLLVSRTLEGSTSFNRRKYIFNKEAPRKVILHLSDKNLVELLDLRSALADVTDFIQNLYRKFMVSIE
jgi:hypothetical protein